MCKVVKFSIGEMPITVYGEKSDKVLIYVHVKADARTKLKI